MPNPSSAVSFSTTRPPNSRRARIMAGWLFTLAAMVFIMVVIGGLTRLTHSGLSMVEWKLFTGWLPPFNDADWLALFSKYQLSPEFAKVNPGMDVEGFKSIFWLEFIHRVWGRLLGVVFFFPYAWFLARGWARPGEPLFWKFTGLFFLGAAQGLMGWYMVVSGLVDRPDVSQYRLTAHFSLALVIIAALLWVGLSLLRPMAESRARQDAGRLRPAAFWLWVWISVTAVSGGFVAGIDAGFGYNTFPLMDDAFIPDGLYATTPFWLAAFEDVLTVQFNHRLLAETTVLFAGLFWLFSRPAHLAPRTRRAINWLTIGVVAQAALGITTLLLTVPVWAASAHQAVAVAVFSLAMWCVFELRTPQT